METRVDRDVDFAVVCVVEWVICLSIPFLFFLKLVYLSQLLEPAPFHKLLEVELISFGHLGCLFHADGIWREIRVLANDTAVFGAFIFFIGPLILKVS